MATVRELCGEALQGLISDLKAEPLKFNNPKFSRRGKGLSSLLSEDGLTETAESIRDMLVQDIMRESKLDCETVMTRLAMKRRYEGRRVWYRGHGEGWHVDNVGRCLYFSPNLKSVEIEVIAGDRPPEVRVLDIGKTTFETWPERTDRYLREAQKDLTYTLAQEEKFLAKARGFRDRADGLKKKIERLGQMPGREREKPKTMRKEASC